jgi:DNA-binding CsgD family transcriptional regulator
MRKRTGTRVHRDAFHLTPRQEEVVGLMAKGHTNAQIADALGITLDGAKAHVSEIISRLGVTTREEAVAAWQSADRRSWLGGLAGPGLVKVGTAAVGVVGVGLAVAWMSQGGFGDSGLVNCPRYDYERNRGVGGAADWAPFVNFDDIHYVRSARLLSADQIGEPYGRVALNIDETPPDHELASTLSCASSVLPVGATLYHVDDYAPTFRIATEDGDVYEAWAMTRDGVGSDFIDIEGRVLALLIGPAGGSSGSRPTRQIMDREVIDDITSALHAGEYRSGGGRSGNTAVLHFRLYDGTTFITWLSWREGALRASIHGVTIPAELAARLMGADQAGVIE